MKTTAPVSAQPFTTYATSPTGETIPVYQNAYYGASPNNDERYTMIRKGSTTPNGLPFDTYGNSATIYLLPETSPGQVERAIAYAATMGQPKIFTITPRD